MKNGVRITGGRWKGRRLPVAPGVRPSSAVLREALTSHWQQRIAGARVLDLYAGSGAVSLELLGRDAAAATLVDDDRSVIDQLNRVAGRLDVAGIEIVRGNLPRCLGQLEPSYDLVFADPPYDFDGMDRLLEAVLPLLAVDGEVAIEVRSGVEIAGAVGGLAPAWQRDYGDSRLVIFGKSDGVTAATQ